MATLPRIVLSTSEGGRPRRSEPVTFGLPFPPGALRPEQETCLVTEEGASAPTQTQVLERWLDGSVRWLLVDGLLDSERSYRLSITPRPATPLLVQPSGNDGWNVDTGVARFTLVPGALFPFGQVAARGEEALDTTRSGIVCETDSSAFPPLVTAAVEQIADGPVRSAFRVDAQPLDGCPARFEAWVHLFAGSATIRVELTIRNPQPAGHPGGIWNLGQSGSIYLRDLSWALALAESDAPIVEWSVEPGDPFVEVEPPVTLFQASSGGDRWNSRNHRNRDRRITLPFRGYRIGPETEARSGERATPIVQMRAAERTVGFATQYFWQNFPKACSVEEGVFRLGLFPPESEDLHELQGGEQKTHSLFFSFGEDTVSDLPLDWCREPLVVHAEPGWYAHAEAVPHLVPEDEDPHTEYVALARSAIDGSDSFAAKREVIDEYGWRHFGDVYGDHEAVNVRGDDPLLSHYNNQYDVVRGLLIHFFRSGDQRWFHAAEELAAHVVDIDLYHTEGDKAAYNHGLFWHTIHYIDADTATHRSYPALPGVNGGGPSGGHLYATGLLLHYYLTGNPRSRRAVEEMGQYVIDSDDGRNTIFRFLDRSRTGHMSSSGFDDFHGPGRTPANAINTAVDAHRLTGEPRFLGKAEELIRRTVHPHDNLEAQNLGDVERRWYYTMFLESLARYLDHKIQLGQLDRMYAWARESLLHYVGWAVENEYPYLDKPDILEFPTETWAAQDMRKTEMFQLASRHADEPFRQRLLERATFFFRHSVDQLSAMPTKSLCRPVALMLSYGYSHPRFLAGEAPACPAPDEESTSFGDPTRFEPQKTRVKRKLRRIAIGGAVAVIAVALALAVTYWR